MQFRILGPLEVAGDDGVLALGGVKPRAVLAVLLLHANEPVSAERLALALWGEDAPGRATKTVQVHVSRLRKALGGGDIVATTPGGYRLRVEPGELDSERFNALVATGRDALAAGEPEHAAAVLREALNLWRGPPLAELAFEPFARQAITRLEEQRLIALEARVDADLAAGWHAALIPELQQLSAAHPTRERLAGQLVLALYRSGRQADALAAYRTTRDLLVDQLGLDPGRELRALEQRVLQQDPALDLVTVKERRPVPVVVEETPSAVVVAPPVIRRSVTVLVVTLRTLSRYNHADPEVGRRLMALGRNEAVRIIVRHGGRFHAGLGSQLLGVFGLSASHEDDALRALNAAVQLREGVTTLMHGEPGTLDLRIGLDAGEIVAEGTGEEMSLFGNPLDGAVGLASIAREGQILLSEATRRLAPDAIRVQPADHDAWLLSAIIPNAPAVRRRHSMPMVGRDEELAIALAAFERATTTRSAQLLTVVGEAGLGKSRLAQEFRHRVVKRATTLVAQCGALGDGSSLWPLRDALADLAGGGSRDAIRRLLGDAEDADQVADLVHAGLGLGDIAADQDRVPWALRRLLETIADAGPLVLILEDAHAAEPRLIDLLEYLVEWLTTAPLFVLCLARPEFLESRRAWIGGRAGVAAISLSPLSGDDAARLLEHLVDERSAPLSRPTDVLDAAEGNPLFIEQMFAMRIEDGCGGEQRIPATIQALVAARLDRLGDGERAVIERASVIGRRFAASAVTELLPVESRPAAGQHLRELVHRGLITPDRSPIGGEDVLRFHHILIRDVAYAVCAKEVRGRVHEDFANSLARREENVDESVGYHLEQAFGYRAELERVDEEARQLATSAAERLAVAGRRALARGDASAASRLLTRAASLFEAGGDVRPDVLLALGSALCDSGDFPAAGPILRTALKAARAQHEETLVARTMLELSNQRLFADPHPDVAAMHETAEEAIKIFDRYGDDSGLARAWNHIGFLHWTRLHMGLVEAALDRSIVYATRVGDARERSEAFNTLLRATVVGPSPVDVGIRRCEAARGNVAEGISLTAVTDITMAVLEAMRMNIDIARDLYQGARQRLEEHGLGLKLAGLEIYAAMVELIAGDPSIVEPGLERAYAALERVGERGRLPTVLAFLARTRCALGAYDDALRFTHLSEKLNYRHDAASQILWAGTRGRVLARAGETGEAERLARFSVTTAQSTDADFLTAQALTDLADVLDVLGKGDEAVAALDQAIVLHEAKQNVASTRSARALRAALVGY
ncbi:AAA family ATPase [Solirubrobacter ginsenosidimutans]|uniref:AAA family ATPase n=1 Tax=Solirubrobacter ginsenosidimutans TaxID=490573 RepID=A0A9X3MUT3_9ACTN|nr:BTAD domain-containing putative transcriptional regulator [Solirubrobacter ginsenosidimutans]MDA0160208.1 AAA family ATPase [Solirubrobacter ginsenosidimutans]